MVTYCTSDQVAEFLQRSVFSATTTPTKSVVENLIERREKYINSNTGHSWKEETITEEYKDPTCFEGWQGWRFDLSHRKIRSFTSGTDKVEVWDGNQWIDFIASKTQSDGPTNGDFFADYTNGVVYIKHQVYKKGVRFTYRYGETSVDKDIEMATVLLVASDILLMNDKAKRFIDDGPTNRPSHDQRIERFRVEAENIIESRREFFAL